MVWFWVTTAVLVAAALGLLGWFDWRARRRRSGPRRADDKRFETRGRSSTGDGPDWGPHPNTRSWQEFGGDWGLGGHGGGAGHGGGHGGHGG
jgi:hypothetical protein